MEKHVYLTPVISCLKTYDGVWENLADIVQSEDDRLNESLLFTFITSGHRAEGNITQFQYAGLENPGEVCRLSFRIAQTTT